ncbi:MAG TPA: alkene reductase [Polyangiaceae bacterium]|nr:alkene reductase [Polyangiaceae bacterium]
MTDKTLFDPVRVGRLTLANRLVMNPMTRCRADAEGRVGELTATYYTQRSSAGLIVTEGIAPSPNGKGYARIPGLWSQDQVESWKPVTQAVHAAGGHIFAQVMHTGRVSHPANFTAGAKVVAPSALAFEGQQIWTDGQGMQSYPVPEALDERGIQQAKDEFQNAAKNAIAAGFDGVELHGANGYLLEQFLSPVTNQRTDGYGGSVANRIRFVVEVAQAVAAAIGGDRLALRISPYGKNGGMSEYPEIDETYLALAKALAPLGLAYLHVADHFATSNGGPGAHPGLEALKSKLREALPGSAFLVGGSLDKDAAERAVKEGKLDLVGFGRAFLANPDLVRRFREGLELNAADPSTFFTPGVKGYTDYATAS